MMTPSRRSETGSTKEQFDAKKFRSTIESAKASGLIRDPLKAIKIEKNGRPATLKGGVQSLWMLVTPAIARQWLTNNFRNRPLNDETVKAYARDMQAGTWVATHQGIAFNDKDELIDGQHRLHAVIRAERDMEMMVTFGLPSKIEGKNMTTMDAVDRGRTRSVADQLKIQHGMKDGSTIAAICSTIGTLCYTEKTKRLSVGQTLDIYQLFRESMMWVIRERSKKHGLRMVGVLAAFTFALQGDADNAGNIETMFKQLVTGKTVEGRELDGSSAMLKLRVFLTSDDAILLNRGSDRGLSELVLQAIALQLEGLPVAKLELNQDGADHFRKLQKERVNKVIRIFKLPT